MYVIVYSDIRSQLIYGTARDITEKRSDMFKLNQIQNALDSETIIAVTDAKGTITEANKKFCQISGYTRDELIGQNHRIINSGKHPKEFFRNMWKTISAGHVWSDIIENRKKNGEPYFVHTIITPIFDLSGKISSYLAIRFDMTDHFQVKADLRRALDILNETGATAKVGGWELDVATSRFTWTDETFKILEVEKNKDRSPVLSEGLALFTSESKPVIERALHRAIEFGEPYDLELEALTAKGNAIWINTNGKANYKDGIVATVSGSIQDITARKTVEIEIETERQKSMQSAKLASLGQLTGGIAHDFNNLLAIMVGNAEMLMLEDGEEKRSNKNIEKIIQTVDRASSLTDRLLAFSRQQVLSPVSADISAHIMSLEEMLSRTLGETIEINFIHAPGLWAATIDSHQFENAIVNLVLNARDAMPQGGVLTVETANVTLDMVTARQYEELSPGDYVKVIVRDSGTGMSDELIEKAFEPFFTTKGVGQGSGLGLSMVFGFAKQSGGHVTIFSEVGHGTTVELYMPRSFEDVTEDSSQSDEEIVAYGTGRILIVEDDENVRNISAIILSEQGYEIESVANGKEAIEKMESGRNFDLLFTDVILPGGITGIEIASQARLIQPAIKVLYTTGYAENALIQNGSPMKDIVMIKKPYRRAELLTQVHDTLN